LASAMRSSPKSRGWCEIVRFFEHERRSHDQAIIQYSRGAMRRVVEVNVKVAGL
jgi:hypothetical protein